MVARQCGQDRVLPTVARRSTTRAMAGSPLPVPAALAAGLVPAELGAAAHARAVRDRQGSCADVAVHDPALVQLDALRAFDVALDFAGDDDRACAHGAGKMRTGLDRQGAVNVDVALELARNTDVAGAVDLAFEAEAR